jgi:hypothetical protein
MAGYTESQIIERLCRAFNTGFSGNRNAMQSLADAIDIVNHIHPRLREVKSEDFLSLFQDRMNIWHPTHIRALVVDILIHLIKDKVTSDSSKEELEQEINLYLMPIKFW